MVKELRRKHARYVCVGSWGMFRLLWLLKNVEDKTKKRVKFYPTHTNLSY